MTAPIGFVDAINSDGTIDGWAYDPDTPSQVISVDLYIGTSTNVAQNTFVGRVSTTVLRTDVNAAFRISGTHGFRFVIPDRWLDGQFQNWTMFAIDSSGILPNPAFSSSIPSLTPQTLSPFRIAAPQVNVAPHDHEIISGVITDADVPGQRIPYTISLLGGPVFTGQTEPTGSFRITVPPVLNLGTTSSVRIQVNNQGSTGRNIEFVPPAYQWPFANFPSTAEASPFFRSSFPTDLRDDKVLTSNRVEYYKERENYLLPTSLKLSAYGVGNYIGPGTQFPEMQNLRPGSTYPAPATTSPIPAGAKIDSYYVHFDPSEPTDPRHRLTYTSGTIAFPNRIIGIIAEQADLDASNATVGRSSTIYGGHRLEIRVPVDEGGSLDSVRVLSDGRTLRYAFRARGLDAFRVITEPTNVIPSFVGTSLFIMNENSVFAGQVLAADPDNGPSQLTYSVDTSSLDGRLFQINSSGSLSFVSAPNFENPQDQNGDNEYELNVSISDGLASVTSGFRVRVSNINEFPSQIVLSNNDVPEKRSSGTAVGIFTTSDPDSGDTFVYSLVDGVGSDDNMSFSIDSATGELETAKIFDFETKSSYSIRVRTTDSTGLSFEKIFEIAITNLAPVVTGLYVRGSSWNTAYLNMLEASGLGTVFAGFRLVDGAGQLANSSVISWQTVNQVSASFDEQVTVDPSTLRLFNSTNTELALAATGAFSFDAATRTAKWTLAGPLQRNKFLASLDAGMIVDGGGAALDGEWTTSVGTYSTSGNGSPGGDLNFRFNYLPGDVSRNGQTNPGDANLLRSLGTVVPTTANYWLDITANNQINAGDANFVASLGTLSLGGFAEPNNPPAPRGGQPLVAASLPPNYKSVSTISTKDIAPIVDAAINNWAALDLTADQVDQLRSVPIIVGDLGPGGYLGMSFADRIVIDDNASGWGWFVDSTPRNNEEYRRGRSSSFEMIAIQETEAAGRMDLLSVVIHELGHQLGLDDDYSDEEMNNVMSAKFATGTRRLPGTSSFSRAQIDNPSPLQVDLHFADMISYSPEELRRRKFIG